MNRCIRWSEYLEPDANVVRLRAETPFPPARLEGAAERLFGDGAGDAEALSSPLTLVATADSKQKGQEPLLSTRLHYFIGAQDGLPVSLRTD
jgi:hypothetical protein